MTRNNQFPVCFCTTDCSTWKLRHAKRYPELSFMLKLHQWMNDSTLLGLFILIHQFWPSQNIDFASLSVSPPIGMGVHLSPPLHALKIFMAQQPDPSLSLSLSLGHHRNGCRSTRSPVFKGGPSNVVRYGPAEFSVKEGMKSRVLTWHLFKWG